MNDQRSFRVLADYEVSDPRPLCLAAGDLVQPRQQDPCWDGWVWVEAGQQAGWIPCDRLDEPAAAQARCRRDFNGTDLSARRGEELTCIESAPGWIFARNRKGETGWFPLFNLRPLDPQAK